MSSQIPMMHHNTVDQVHDELIRKLRVIQEFIEQGKPVENEMKQLLRMSKEHFANEERLMDQTAYPAIGAHQVVHDRMLGLIEMIGYIPNKTTDRLEYHMANLTEKFVEHVKEYDTAFFEFYNAQIHGDVV